MTATDNATTRVVPYIEELLDNTYARENLREGAQKLRLAYRRSQKRRVKAARDERLRRQVRAAVESIAEAGKAVQEHRDHPRRHRARWMLVGAVVAAVVALALRGRVSGPAL